MIIISAITTQDLIFGWVEIIMMFRVVVLVLVLVLGRVVAMVMGRSVIPRGSFRYRLFHCFVISLFRPDIIKLSTSYSCELFGPLEDLRRKGAVLLVSAR